MQILTKLTGATYRTSIKESLLGVRLPVEAEFTLPRDSCRRTALAKLLDTLTTGERTIEITGWKVWPSCEHFDLFDRYRFALGESRPLWEAPFHVFSELDRESFISILCMVLYFSWDAEILCPTACVYACVDHDDSLLLRCADPGVADQVRAMLHNHDPSSSG